LDRVVADEDDLLCSANDDWPEDPDEEAAHLADFKNGHRDLPGGGCMFSACERLTMMPRRLYLQQWRQFGRSIRASPLMHLAILNLWQIKRRDLRQFFWPHFNACKTPIDSVALQT